MNFFHSIQPRARTHWIMRVLVTLSPWLLVVALGGCIASAPPLHKVDLGDPGWRLWRGQALWKANVERPALAGDLIVAHHINGDILVSFSKSPLPIVTARTAGDWWRIDFVERGRFFEGRGRPPQRIIWFLLPDLLEGASTPENWEVDATTEGEWSMANQQTGETIRMVMD